MSNTDADVNTVDVDYLINNGDVQTLELTKEQFDEWDGDTVATACAEAGDDSTDRSGTIEIISPSKFAGSYSFDLDA